MHGSQAFGKANSAACLCLRQATLQQHQWLHLKTEMLFHAKPPVHHGTAMYDEENVLYSRAWDRY